MKKLNKNKIEIINIFRKNIFFRETIRGISLKLKKSYPGAHRIITELENDKIIETDKKGNSSICSLKISKETIAVLSFLDYMEAFSKNIPNFEKIIERKEFSEDIIIVAGSYAKGKQTSKSDIDIAVITKQNAYRKQKFLENISLAFSPEVHPISFTYKDFIGMLNSREENFGKEIFKNHLIFKNAEKYYFLIKEAIDNGFRG